VQRRLKGKTERSISLGRRPPDDSWGPTTRLDDRELEILGKLWAELRLQDPLFASRFEKPRKWPRLYRALLWALHALESYPSINIF
jgi:hypothetical protein